ncbi:MAG: sugar phosphate nucleotidyltransferase [Clostridia bacterium]|nr:sugar phosphate nucleotidyltransferase [Clostridia bacterium]
MAKAAVGYEMTLVILAAGMGSRYGGLKQLDPISDKGEFIIDFSIYDAIKAGFDKVVFVIKKENFNDFRETVGDRVSKSIKVEYAFQDICNIPEGFSVPEGRTKPWGTAHAVLSAKEYVHDNFAVINSDDFYGRDAFVKLAEHLKNAENGKLCMVGYVLNNTLTENGTVSRGECSISPEGYLIDVTERTKLKRDGDMAAYEEDGVWHKIPKDTIVSMNCIGFTPSVFEYIENGFKSFMGEKGSELKSEYYLPTAIKEMMSDGVADVKVYSTDAVWYGVTYHEDKKEVQESIRKMIANGIYPSGLWE